MKKFILIFFISLYPIYAATISFSLSSAAQANLNVNGETTSFNVSVSQNEHGKLIFRPCNIFTYKKGNYKIGELESSKDYYGISYSHKNWSFFFSNPVFVPTASHSAGISFTSDQFYAKAIIENRKSVKDSLELDYQLNWKEIKNGLYHDLLIGTTDSFNLFGITADSDFHYSESEAEINLTLNCKTVKLGLKEALKNGRAYNISFSCGDFLKSEWNYHIEPKTDYAGQANPSEITLETDLFIQGFAINSKSVIEYKRETGKFARTDLKIGYKSQIINFDITSSYQRTRGTKNGFSHPSVSLEFNNVNFALKNKKLYLTITVSQIKDKCKTELKITQDRVFTLSMSFDN